MKTYLKVRSENSSIRIFVYENNVSISGGKDEAKTLAKYSMEAVQSLNILNNGSFIPKSKWSSRTCHQEI